MVRPRATPAHARAVSFFVLSTAACASLAACSASSAHHGSGGGAATSPNGGSAGDDCTTLCATETKACPMTSTGCVAACEISKVEVPWCKPVATAATECLAEQPAGSFQCDTNGQPTVGSGVCTSETAAMTDCWYNGPSGGLPDLTQACTSVCMKESSLSCADTNCVAGCEAAVMPGVKCHGAFAAWVYCAWKQAATSFTCDTESPPRATLKDGYCAFEDVLLYGCLQGM